MSKEDKFNFTSFLLGILFLIVLTLVIFFVIVLMNQPQRDMPAQVQQQMPTKVEFCNNTHLLREDAQGNQVDGQIWMSSNSNRFEKVNNISQFKIQKGIDYVYWIESKDYYVSPTQFHAKCINENDTQPDYINIKAFKSDNATIRILDSHDLISSIIRFVPDAKGAYYSNFDIRYYPPFKERKFMPFGATMIIEYPKYIFNVVCAGFPMGYPSISQTIDSMNNTMSAFMIPSDWEDKDGMTQHIQCQMEFSNPNNKQYVDGGYIKVTILPSNFFLTKTQELRMDVDKSFDEDFSLVGIGKISTRANIAVA